MRALVLKIAINALAIWMATLVVPQVRVNRGSGDLLPFIGTFILIAMIFGVVNAIIKPVVKLFALPLYFVSLGLMAFVINALMLALTAWLAGDFFNIGSFLRGALPAAIIITFVSMILHIILPDGKSKDS